MIVFSVLAETQIRADRWCSKATQLLQVVKMYFLIIIAGATVNFVFHFPVNQKRDYI